MLSCKEEFCRKTVDEIKANFSPFRSLPILKPNSKGDIQILNPESQDQSVLRKTQTEILLSV